jgi:hypothetical protein
MQGLSRGNHEKNFGGGELSVQAICEDTQAFSAVFDFLILFLDILCRDMLQYMCISSVERR